jgi:hypothetical protein
VDEGLATGRPVAHAGAVMNRPVQVMLDPDDRRRARRRAAESGLTMSEYINWLVRHDLESWTPKADAPAIIPIDDSGATDMPAHKNRYIGEAVAARLDKTGPGNQQTS